MEVQTAESPEVVDGQQLFDELYRTAFEVRRTLGLDRLHHVFDIIHPRYTRVTFRADAYDAMAVTLHFNQTTVGESPSGAEYRISRERTISAKGDGGMTYYYYDALGKHKRGDDPPDIPDELDDGSEDYDFSEPLPPYVLELLREMKAILPTLTLEQYVNEESEDWFMEERYDYGLQRELKKLETAFSTAGGAMYLLQLVALEAYKRHLDHGGPAERIEFNPYGSKECKIYIESDSIPAKLGPWAPVTFGLERSSIYGYSTYSGWLSDVQNRSLVIMEDGSVVFGVSDAIGEDGSYTVIGPEYDKRFSPDEELDEDPLELAKTLLKDISDYLRPDQNTEPESTE